jgi:di/tricarboxylate transporter
MPGPHAIALIAITVATFYLYTRSWIRLELVSLLLLLSLLLLFHLFPYAGHGAPITETQVFEAFGHPALIAICCLMILGRGLTMTGAIEPATRILARLWKFNRWLGLLLTLLVAGAASAFINDTPVLVLMLPLLLGLAARTGYPAARTLMPVNFAILAGGMLTSIGTSTNLLVLRIAEDLGMRPMGLFDFTQLALIAFAAAVLYLWLVVPLLLPRTEVAPASAQREYEARVLVEDEKSRLFGRTPAELARTLGRELRATAVMRLGRKLGPADAGRLGAGDALLLRDTPEGLREVASAFNVQLYDRDGAGRFIQRQDARGDMHLAEIVIGADSPLNGHTLKQQRFAEEHEVVAVGLSRGTEGLLHGARDIADIPLGAGDLLLVQGTDEKIKALRDHPGLMLLDLSLPLPRSPLARHAILIMTAVVALAALKLVPIHVAAFMGVIAMLITGCVRLEGIGAALSLEVVLLVASSVALGQSLISTGAADWIAQGVTRAVEYLPAAAQVGAFMAFAAVLTNFVSNAAAASVGTPIAIATAHQLGLPVEPFVLAVLFGANLSYATPMAYQTNLLVMNAGGYSFRDFVRAGGPLVLLMLVILSVLLTRRYGL